MGIRTILQPDSVREPAFARAVQDLAPDLIVVVAYGQILPKSVLDIPAHGCINVHASLLPRWRGAAPIQRAILAGDAETGITIMQMDEGLDTGAMLAVKADYEIVHRELADIGINRSEIRGIAYRAAYGE